MSDESVLGEVKKFLSYDPLTGHFIWIGGGKGIRTGSRAGTVRATGHRVIVVRRRLYQASRLAWYFTHGKMPRRLRFINGDVDDLRIENLGQCFSISEEHDLATAAGRAAYQRAYRSVRSKELSDKERERTFGIDAERYAEMVEEQNGLCAICGRPERETRNGKVKALAVDHCHETGRIRGLLCVACNTGLGKLGDNREVLLKAVAYLDRRGH